MMLIELEETGVDDLCETRKRHFVIQDRQFDNVRISRFVLPVLNLCIVCMEIALSEKNQMLFVPKMLLYNAQETVGIRRTQKG